MQRFLYKLERKIGRIAIPRLILYVVCGQLVVFLSDWLMPALSLSGWLSLDVSMVLKLQLWRLITFIIVPESSGGLLILLMFYFYWIIGNSLEQIWGAFQFTMYYLIGVVCAILAAFVSYFISGRGYGMNYYLHMSMFFAFALLDPDFTVLLFFVLPVKIKWLALFDAALFAYGIVVGCIARDWSIPIAIVFSLINLLLFFWDSLFSRIRKSADRFAKRRRYNQTRKQWDQSRANANKKGIHVAGRDDDTRWGR